MKIKKQLLKCIASVIFVYGILTVTSAFYVKNINSMLKEENHIYLNEVANQSAKAISNKLDGDMRMLRAIAVMLGDQSSVDVSHWVETFKSEYLFEEFQRVGIILPDGRGYGQDVSGTNFSDREYFKKAMSGQYFISDAMIDRTTGELSNAYAVPIYNDGKIIGILAAVTHTDVYKKILYTDVFNGKGYTYIVKNNGDPIVMSNHPDSSPDFVNIFETVTASDEQIEDMKFNMTQGLSGKLDYISRNKDRFLNYVPLGINNWFVISVVPYDAVKEKSQRIMNITIASSAVIIICFGALITYIFVSQLKNSQKLSKLAFVDELTNVPNKNMFKLIATDLLNEPKTKYAFIIADINKFKIINDFFGYSQGDLLLIHMSNVIKSHLTKNETFARITADTFHMLLEYENKIDLEKRIKDISGKLCSYKFVSDTSYNISIGFGIYVIENTSNSIESMGDKASLALKNIKNFHSTACFFYNDDIRNKIIEEKEIENDMQRGVDNNEFHVYLQPQCSLVDSSIKGAEALVRWIHPLKGFITPDDFIPIFEKNGFITTLDMYMLDSVCKQLRIWIDKGYNPVPISVNQSRLHLYDPNYINNLSSVLKKYNIDASLIALEITESAFFDDTNLIIKIVTALHYLGFKISMDDFGSGYSSLNMLQDIFVDVIKIDKKFFTESSNTDRGRKIVNNIISMASDLKIKVISEGVENTKQIEFLQTTECDLVQGYYFSKPISIPQFEKISLYTCENK